METPQNSGIGVKVSLGTHLKRSLKTTVNAMSSVHITLSVFTKITKPLPNIRNAFLFMIGKACDDKGGYS